MDSVLVVIRLTGLLLFSQPSGGPMRILMPFPSGMSPHVAQVGFYTNTSAGCDQWVKENAQGTRGVCYFRVDNATLDIGRQGNSQPVVLPVGNMSRANSGHRPVAQKFLEPVLGNVPELKGRITLHEGTKQDCALARFEFQQGSALDSMDLVNVVNWTYKLPPNSTVDLVRRRLRAGGPRDTTITVKPDLTGKEIDIFIRHVPDPDMTGPMSHGDEVKHFRAYYSLLTPSVPNGPVPRYGRAHVNAYCEWPTSWLERVIPPNAGTMSCMVASADPPP